MKTYRDLYARVCSFDNLYHACRAARRGKRSVESVAAFEYDQEAELLRLRDELRTGAWQPGPYHSFYIHDPKRRLISAAPFRDRVVHHALINVIEPIWERRFIHDSYANRLGKGTHRALDRCQQFARRWRYVLQCDLKQYFPSIDHALLRAELARLIHDERVMELCDGILASGVGVLAEDYDMQWFPGDDLLAAVRARGLRGLSGQTAPRLARWPRPGLPGGERHSLSGLSRLSNAPPAQAPQCRQLSAPAALAAPAVR